MQGEKERDGERERKRWRERERTMVPALAACLGGRSQRKVSPSLEPAQQPLQPRPSVASST